MRAEGEQELTQRTQREMRRRERESTSCATSGAHYEVGVESNVEVLKPSLSDGFRMTSCLWLRARLRLNLNRTLKSQGAAPETIHY